MQGKVLPYNMQGARKGKKGREWGKGVPVPRHPNVFTRQQHWIEGYLTVSLLFSGRKGKKSPKGKGRRRKREREGRREKKAQTGPNTRDRKKNHGLRRAPPERARHVPRRRGRERGITLNQCLLALHDDDDGSSLSHLSASCQ